MLLICLYRCERKKKKKKKKRLLSLIEQIQDKWEEID